MRDTVNWISLQPFPMEQRQGNHYLKLGRHNYNSSSAHSMRMI